MRILPGLVIAAALPTLAAAAKPEIVRNTGSPQTAGTVHTVRVIPEACARLEGMFTGDAAQPYRFAARRSSQTCQPRARMVDFATSHPSEATGWKFNDEIRIPNASCPTQLAVVRVWRKPVNVAPPKLDAQGRARIYLHDAKQQAQQQGAPDVPLYATDMKLEGKSCSK